MLFLIIFFNILEESYSECGPWTRAGLHTVTRDTKIGLKLRIGIEKLVAICYCS